MAEAAIKQNVFAWEGTDRKGKRIKGESRAANPAMVKADLRRQGISIKSQRSFPLPRKRKSSPRISPSSPASWPP